MLAHWRMRAVHRQDEADLPRDAAHATAAFPLPCASVCLPPLHAGFEQMGVPLPEEPRLAEQYSEQYYAAEYEQEQEGGSRSVFGSAYRRRG